MSGRGDLLLEEPGWPDRMHNQPRGSRGELSSGVGQERVPVRGFHGMASMPGGDVTLLSAAALAGCKHACILGLVLEGAGCPTVEALLSKHRWLFDGCEGRAASARGPRVKLRHLRGALLKDNLSCERTHDESKSKLV